MASSSGLEQVIICRVIMVAGIKNFMMAVNHGGFSTWDKMSRELLIQMIHKKPPEAQMKGQLKELTMELTMELTKG